VQQQPLIFISYSRKNASLVDTIEHRIQARGFRTWVDRQGLSGGQQWANAIQQAIVQCDLYLLMLTPDALTSNFVWNELRFARSLGKRAIVVYAQTVAQFPTELQGLPVIDFRKRREQGFFRLFDAIDRVSVRLVTPPGGFDGELALTLAYNQRAPGDWQVAFVSRGRYALMAALYGILAIIFVPLAFLAVANDSAFVGFYTALFQGFGPVVKPIGDFVIYFVAAISAILTGLYLRLATGITPPEMLAVTPQGFAWRQFQPWRRYALRTRQFAYSEITALAVHQFPFRGTGLRFDTVRPLEQHVSLTILGRFGDARALAERVAAAYQRYRSTMAMQAPPPAAGGQPAYASQAYAPPATATAAPVQATPVQPPQMAPAPAPVPPRIFICGTNRNRGFVRRLQQRLAYRQITFYDGAQYARSPAQAQQALDACPVVVVLVSTESAGSNLVRQQYLYVLNRQKTVIPFVLQPGIALPVELRPLQWIDFSQSQAWERRILDFILSLVAVGMQFPPGVFDGELALARTMHSQMPTGWTGFRVQPATYTARYRRALPQAILYTIMGVVQTLLALALIVLGFVLEHFLGVGVALLLLLVGLALAVTSWIRPAMYIAQARAFSQLMRDIAVPDLVTVTPEGWAIQYRAGRFARFKIGYYAFDAYADITAQRFFNSIVIHMRGKDGKTTKMRIPGIFDDPTAIAESIMTAFRASQQRVPAAYAAAVRR
jgi:hypothetical protein